MKQELTRHPRLHRPRRQHLPQAPGHPARHPRGKFIGSKGAGPGSTDHGWPARSVVRGPGVRHLGGLWRYENGVGRRAELECTCRDAPATRRPPGPFISPVRRPRCAVSWRTPFIQRPRCTNYPIKLPGADQPRWASATAGATGGIWERLVADDHRLRAGRLRPSTRSPRRLPPAADRLATGCTGLSGPRATHLVLGALQVADGGLQRQQPLPARRTRRSTSNVVSNRLYGAHVGLATDGGWATRGWAACP